MVSTVRKLRIFVASPGDVSDERGRLQAVVNELNRTIGDEKGIVLELIRWETHVAPDMGRPQEVVNRQIGEHDIFVGIMWKRFGTPTGNADSGTEEEFDNAYASRQATKRPRIMLYFNQAPFMPRSDAEVEQMRKVLAFKEKVRSLYLIAEYSGPDAFERLVREHLQRAIRDILPSAAREMHSHSENASVAIADNRPAENLIRWLAKKEANLRRKNELYVPLHKEIAALCRRLHRSAMGEAPYPAWIEVAGESDALRAFDPSPAAYNWWPEFGADGRRTEFPADRQQQLDALHENVRAYNAGVRCARARAVGLFVPHVAAAIESVTASAPYRARLQVYGERTERSAPVERSPETAEDAVWYETLDMVIRSHQDRAPKVWTVSWLENWEGSRPATFGWLLAGSPERAMGSVIETYARLAHVARPPKLSWLKAIFLAAWPDLLNAAQLLAARDAGATLCTSAKRIEDDLNSWLIQTRDEYEGGVPD